jgi:hypothetical protein
MNEHENIKYALLKKLEEEDLLIECQVNQTEDTLCIWWRRHQLFCEYDNDHDDGLYIIQISFIPKRCKSFREMKNESFGVHDIHGVCNSLKSYLCKIK